MSENREPFLGPQRSAILKLLNDEDPKVVDMVIKQLLARGESAEADISALLPDAGPRARRILMEARRRAQERLRGSALKQRSLHIKTLAELEDFCWKFAQWNDPDTDVAEARHNFDLWAETVRKRIQPDQTETERVQILASVLGKEEGLFGNSNNYYDPNNSFLDSVVLSRQGIPISLSAVYMFVGARAGLKVEGIGMPDHFITRLGSVYFDPFHGGQILDRAKLISWLAERGLGEEVDDFLEPLPFHLIAQRMVRNLLAIYERFDDQDRVDSLREILSWVE